MRWKANFRSNPSDLLKQTCFFFCFVICFVLFCLLFCFVLFCFIYLFVCLLVCLFFSPYFPNASSCWSLLLEPVGLGVATWCIFPIGYSVLLPWIQTSLSEKSEIVFNLSKGISWAYSFAKKKRRVFALFEKPIFEYASRFYGKKRKIGKGNLYFSENRLSRNEMRCAADIQNHMSQICAKGFLDSNFN